MQTTVSEEGTSHLTDDGWAETQSQIVEIRDFFVNLRNGDGQFVHEYVKSQEIEERKGSIRNVQEEFNRHDLMHRTDDNFGGTEVEVAVDVVESKIAETEDDMV